MDLGPYAAFIVAAYAAACLTLSAVVAWLLIDGKRLQRELERLEAAGVRRRSAVRADAPHRAT